MPFLQGECSHRRAEEEEEIQALDQGRSTTYLDGECSYRGADSVRRFNAGRVVVLNDPPALSVISYLTERSRLYRRLKMMLDSFFCPALWHESQVEGHKLTLKANFESGSTYFSVKALKPSAVKLASPGVNLGSTWGQPGVNLGSTWGQPGVNLG